MTQSARQLSENRAFDFHAFDVEQFFVKRLKQHRPGITAGLTDSGDRRERIRAAIIECGLDCAIIGRKPDGRSETYAEAFTRFYGEPLEPKRKEKRT